MSFLSNIDLLEVICGMIPEAIFFSLFLIIGKDLKEKRVLFTFIMILFYLMFQIFFYKNIGIQIFWYFIPLMVIKYGFKRSINIVDIFYINVAILMSLIITIPLTIVNLIINNIYVMTFINKIISIIILLKFSFVFKNIYNFYLNNWNRNNLKNKKIKSLTLRNISLIIMNLLLFIGNYVLTSN